MQRKTIKTLAALTAACIAPTAFALTSAGAAIKSQPAGTAFAADTADGGVHLVLSNDRRQVRTALFAYKQKCSDADTFYDFDGYQDIPISASRKFSYQYNSGPQASTATPGVTVTLTHSFSGLLNKAATRIVGTARTTLAIKTPDGNTVTCDTGAVKFIAKD